ncbi:lysylphosphatidylglycerol synthase transmembrane domain-containing protein [Luteolibacter sp. AS25]|uniref:lysylphosphatidylglycerol synthase transmembrane domain-containing protein n=1 Tax=Luteolibacter sp. AS25 TaxID=3135776 RepID=UPI00398B2D69
MNSTHLKTAGLLLLKIAGTTLFLWWAFSQIEDKQLLYENFQRAIKSPFWVTTGIGFAFLSIFTSALRWYFLLRAQSINESFLYILRLTLYGTFFNIASIGGAAGDAAKIVLLIRRFPEKKIPITVSVMIDHLIGFLSSSIIFLSFTWIFGAIEFATDATGRNTFIAATWFQAGALFVVLSSLFSCSPTMMNFGRKYLPLITKNRWVDSITAAIDLYRTGWKHALAALFVSFILSATFYLTFYAGIRSLGQEIQATTIMAVMPLVDVVTALPISISGLGVRERTFDFLLGKLTGIPTASAIAGSLIGFLFTLFWGLIGGLAIITSRSGKADE